MGHNACLPLVQAQPRHPCPDRAHPFVIVTARRGPDLRDDQIDAAHPWRHAPQRPRPRRASLRQRITRHGIGDDLDRPHHHARRDPLIGGKRGQGDHRIDGVEPPDGGMIQRQDPRSRGADIHPPGKGLLTGQTLPIGIRHKRRSKAPRRRILQHIARPRSRHDHLCQTCLRQPRQIGRVQHPPLAQLTTGQGNRMGQDRPLRLRQSDRPEPHPRRSL